MKVEREEIRGCNLSRSARGKVHLQLRLRPVYITYEVEFLTQGIDEAVVVATTSVPSSEPAPVHLKERPVSSDLHLEDMWDSIAPSRIRARSTSPAIKKRTGGRVVANLVALRAPWQGGGRSAARSKTRGVWI